MKIIISALAVSLTLACSGAGHDRFPTRPIEMVIAFPPGGMTDIAARIFAEQLSRMLDVPIVPTNRGGASGVLGGSVMLQAPKNGYTLLTSSLSGMVLAPTVMTNVTFTADEDFVPITLILTVPNSLIVRAASPFKTVNEVIDAARRRPGTLSYASPGTASDGHFNGEVFSRAASIEIKHVPFTGGGEVLTAVIGGHVDFGIGAASSFMALGRGGKVRTLAVTGKTRLKALPDAPTFEERGISGTFLDGWVGCFAPAGTPQPVLDILVDAAAKIVQSPVFIAKVEAIGGIPGHMRPEEFLAMIQADKTTAINIATKVGLLRGQ